MKTVSIEFPVQEAVDMLRLLRVESRCLIENSDNFQDRDVLRRASSVLSARERIVTALEGVAETEPDTKVTLPRLNQSIPARKFPKSKFEEQKDALTRGVVNGDIDPQSRFGLGADLDFRDHVAGYWDGTENEERFVPTRVSEK